MKTESRYGLTVRVTTDPLLKRVEQVLPQSIPAGLEVTVPLPRRPVFITVRGICSVKLLVLTAVPPGALTLSSPVVAPAGTVA